MIGLLKSAPKKKEEFSLLLYNCCNFCKNNKDFRGGNSENAKKVFSYIIQLKKQKKKVNANRLLSQA